MRCPSCGLEFDQSAPDRCPRCGRALTSASAAAAQPQPPQAPQAPQPPQPPSYQPYPLNPAPTAAPVAPTAAEEPDRPPTPSGPPPTAPGYVPPGYTQGLRPPPPVRRQRRVGLIVGIIAAVVVLLAACAGGAIWATRSMGEANGANFFGTPAASTSSTPDESVVYYESFSTSAEGWAQDPGHCYLDQDGYHAQNNYLCFAPIGDQANGSVSVLAQQLSGPTTKGYGLTFRRLDADNGYRFAIDGEGEWAFDKCVNGACTTLVVFTPNSAIKGGLHVANTLKVTATGSHFEFFVNDTKVGSFDDATFASGAVGIFGGDTIDCVFTHFTVSAPLS